MSENNYENPLAYIAQKADDLIGKLKAKIKTNWEDVTIEPTDYLDPTKPFKPPEWALSMHGVPFYAFDDYNYLQGQAGNGKSYTFRIYQSVILGKKFGDIEYVAKREKPKILHVDTEQSEGNVQLHVRILYHMVGWEQGSDHSDQLKVMMLRDTPNPEERWAKIIKAVVEFKPDFLFIDGMLDIVTGMNDDESCNLVISEAGALSSLSSLCLIGVNHENPRNPKANTEGPDKPAGTIGSYTQRKGSAGQSTVKELPVDDPTNPIFHVVPKKIRNKDYIGFDFVIKDEPVVCDGKEYIMGIPHWVEPKGLPVVVETEEDKLRKSVTSAIMSISWPISGLRYQEFEQGLKRYGITSNRKLSDYITMAQKYGIVAKDETAKRYFLTDVSKFTDTQTRTDNTMNEDNDDPF